jgi:hypothetical protein
LTGFELYGARRAGSSRRMEAPWKPLSAQAPRPQCAPARSESHSGHLLLIVRFPSNRRSSTPDLVTARTGVARSGVPQREAALDGLVLPAHRCCCRLIAGRTRAATGSAPDRCFARRSKRPRRSTAPSPCSSISRAARAARSVPAQLGEREPFPLLDGPSTGNTGCPRACAQDDETRRLVGCVWRQSSTRPWPSPAFVVPGICGALLTCSAEAVLDRANCRGLHRRRWLVERSPRAAS